MAAYFIVEVDVTNPEGYSTYVPLAGESVARHGGRFIVRGGNPELIEGSNPPKRVVVLEFPDVASAKAWYNSPDYQEALKIRLANSTARAVLVEGAP